MHSRTSAGIAGAACRQHLQEDPPLCGEAPRSMWSGHQAGGGLAQQKCSATEGRSGLFTTSRPGWTPCRNVQGSRSQVTKITPSCTTTTA